MNYTKTKLLSTNNFKTIKGEKLGYVTYIMYLSPFTDNSKGINLCAFASEGCSKACLFNSGFGGMYKTVGDARRNKTEWYLSNRSEFMATLDAEITKYTKLNLGKAIPVFRLNGTSDIPFEKIKVRDGKNIFELHPTVQFYDYTKNYLRFDKVLPANYHLTFSRSEINNDMAMSILERGFNVAWVFTKLPETFNGYKVMSGDNTDLRFTDEKNVIVGLTYKKNTGKGGEIANMFAKESGFVTVI